MYTVYALGILDTMAPCGKSQTVILVSQIPALDVRFRLFTSWGIIN